MEFGGGPGGDPVTVIGDMLEAGGDEFLGGHLGFETGVGGAVDAEGGGFIGGDFVHAVEESHLEDTVIHSGRDVGRVEIVFQADIDEDGGAWLVEGDFEILSGDGFHGGMLELGNGVDLKFVEEGMDQLLLPWELPEYSGRPFDDDTSKRFNGVGCFWSGGGDIIDELQGGTELRAAEG